MDKNVVLNIGLFVFVGGFILLIIRYLWHFKNLRKAYMEAGIDWPMPNKDTPNNNRPVSDYKKILSGPYKLLILILFNKPNNPLLWKSVRGIRYTWIKIGQISNTTASMVQTGNREAHYEMSGLTPNGFEELFK